MRNKTFGTILAGSLLFTLAPMASAQDESPAGAANTLGLVPNVTIGGQLTPDAQRPSNAAMKIDKNGRLYRPLSEDISRNPFTTEDGHSFPGMKMSLAEDGPMLDTPSAGDEPSADAGQTVPPPEFVGEVPADGNASVATADGAAALTDTAAAPTDTAVDPAATDAPADDATAAAAPAAPGSTQVPGQNNFQPDTWTMIDENGDVVSAVNDPSEDAPGAPVTSFEPGNNQSSFPAPGKFTIQNEGIVTPPPLPPKKGGEIPPIGDPPKKPGDEIVNEGGSEGQDETDENTPDQVDIDVEVGQPDSTDGGLAEKPTDETQEDGDPDLDNANKDIVVAGEANTVILDRTVPSLIVTFTPEDLGVPTVYSITEDPENLNAHPGTKTVLLEQEGPNFFADIASGDVVDPEEAALDGKVVKSPLEGVEGPLTIDMIQEANNPISYAEITTGKTYFAEGVRVSYELSIFDNYETDRSIPVDEASGEKDWSVLDHIIRVNTNHDVGVEHEMNPDGMSGVLLFRAANFAVEVAVAADDTNPAQDTAAEEPKDESADATQDDGAIVEGMEVAGDTDEAEAAPADDEALPPAGDEPAAPATDESQDESTVAAADDAAGTDEDKTEEADADEAIEYSFKIELEDTAGNKLTVETPICVYKQSFDVTSID